MSGFDADMAARVNWNARSREQIREAFLAQYDGPAGVNNARRTGIQEYHCLLREATFDAVSSLWDASLSPEKNSLDAFKKLLNWVWGREKALRQDYEVNLASALQEVDALEKRLQKILGPILDSTKDLGVSKVRIEHALYRITKDMSEAVRNVVLLQNSIIENSRQTGEKPGGRGLKEFDELVRRQGTNQFLEEAAAQSFQEHDERGGDSE